MFSIYVNYISIDVLHGKLRLLAHLKTDFGELEQQEAVL